MDDSQRNKKIDFIKILIIVFVAGSILLLMFKYVFLNKETQKKTKASGESVALSFDPLIINAPQGQDFTTVLKMKPSIDLLTRGYYFKVNFDKTKTQLKNIEYKLGTASAGLGDDNSNLTTINSRGYAYLQGEIQTPTGQTISTQDTDAVSLTFTSAANDPYTISLNPEQAILKKINADYSFSDVPVVSASSGGILAVNGVISPTTTPPTDTPTATPTVTQTGNMTLNLRLKFQGMARKPQDSYNQMAVQVKLTGGSLGSTVVTRSAVFSVAPADESNGVWSGTAAFDAPAGSGYSVLVKGPKHVQKKICDLAPQESSPGTYHCSTGRIDLADGLNNLNFSGVILLAGDLPEQDGVVNSYDISLVQNNIGKTDAESLKQSDLNLDGAVNSMDYSLIISALSIKYDEGEDITSEPTATPSVSLPSPSPTQGSAPSATPTPPAGSPSPTILSTGDLLRDGTSYPFYASIIFDSDSCYEIITRDGMTLDTITLSILGKSHTYKSVFYTPGSPIFLIGDIAVNDLLTKDFHKDDQTIVFSPNAAITVSVPAKNINTEINLQKLVDSGRYYDLSWCTSTDKPCLGADSQITTNRYILTQSLTVKCK